MGSKYTCKDCPDRKQETNVADAQNAKAVLNTSRLTGRLPGQVASKLADQQISLRPAVVPSSGSGVLPLVVQSKRAQIDDWWW